MLGVASTASSASARRGAPSSTSPTTLTKQKTASAAVAARPAAAMAPASPSPREGPRATWTSACRVSHSEAKPLSGGTPAIAIDPTRKAPPVQGMRRSSPPMRSRSREPTRALEGAGREEQQRLEHRVVEDVQERRGEGDRRPGRIALRGEEDGCAEPERDDPDVLDRVKGEQPLQVVLHQRVEHAAQRGQQPQAEDHQPRP